MYICHLGDKILQQVQAIVCDISCPICSDCCLDASFPIATWVLRTDDSKKHIASLDPSRCKP